MNADAERLSKEMVRCSRKTVGSLLVSQSDNMAAVTLKSTELVLCRNLPLTSESVAL